MYVLILSDSGRIIHVLAALSVSEMYTAQYMIEDGMLFLDLSHIFGQK